MDVNKSGGISASCHVLVVPRARLLQHVEELLLGDGGQVLRPRVRLALPLAARGRVEVGGERIALKTPTSYSMVFTRRQCQPQPYNAM